ncbi:carboxyl transferase domain-containing protein [Arachnia propionica]|uniref:biotin carboxylase n=1 Tax=Arachnia propionica TaxID=1750 RepID=A0A3P1WMG8_9ACTN|nr:carboxyl transferase domain-containing protein [Arachnia propionica]RRD47375.1 ATP-grasp domain-containing protein [Arachnia propionica]
MFRRIAIVNRGEAAMRLIHAVRDLNAESGAEPIATIALHTDAERTAMFAREADEAYSIGPASARPYINHDLLARTLVEVGADAVWVGWGFVAEDADFAERVEQLGITFIGPSPDAMRRLGDKIGSKLLAEEVGVPVAAWSGGGVDTLDDALAAAARIGYPLMLKATAGGGGRGIRRVDSAEALTDAYQRTRDEAERAFGCGTVFLERLVTGARHVEVQLIADGTTAWAIGVRDCTVQRRNQKIIEESASPLLSRDQTDELRAAAERLAVAVGYRGAGTVEFLYQPDEQAFAFLEVNTRLQVEHPITEVTCDFDLVKAQIRVAAGEPLGERPVEAGHAVEARLNAEDPDRDFAPAPGRIDHLSFGCGPGVRIDTGVAEGDEIPADFDSMIAKIIAHGRTREEALARLRRALNDTTVVIAGGATNKSFVLELLDRPEVVGAPGVRWADTSWIDRTRADGGLVADRHSEIALVAAAIEAHRETERQQIARLLETARGGRPQIAHDAAVTIDLKLRGEVHQLTVSRIGWQDHLVSDGTRRVRARVEQLDRLHSRITVEGERHRLLVATHGPIHLVEVDGVAHRISRDEGGVVRAPAPALVVATPVAVGDEVAAGDVVVVLESMKMETALVAPFAARIREVLAKPGTQVEGLAPLLRLEPVCETHDETVAGGLDLPAPRHLDPAAAWREALDDLTAVVLGFDADPEVLPRYLAARETHRAAGGDVLTGECDLLATFSDIAELGRNRPADEQARTELRIHSDREHLHTFLTTLDAERAGLPATFVNRLTRALAHHGIASLDRTPQLEEAVFRIFLAQQNSRVTLGLILGVLERWLTEPAPDGAAAGTVRLQLERLKQATQLRHAILADLARSVRFRWFDEPPVQAERAQIWAEMRDEVARLAADPDAPGYADGIARLVAVPEKNDVTLAQRLADGERGPEPMLEVLARKHYGPFGLQPLVEQVDGRSVVSGEYTVDGRRSQLITTTGSSDELGADGPLAALVLARCADPGDGVVVELYLAHDGPEPDLRSRIGAWLPDAVRRVVVGLCGPGGSLTYVTLRRGQGLVEDEVLRDHHPMVARRLDLWRLSEFDLERLPAADDDVLLISARARTNASDHRLIAMAQVRQESVIRDGGRLVAVPHVERAIEHCLESIRRARKTANVDLNHVWVNVWPTLELDPREARHLQRRITPLTDSTGIEEVVVHGTFVVDGEPRDLAVRFHRLLSGEVGVEVQEPFTEPLQPMDDYQAKVLRARSRGLVYPYELAGTLAGDGGSVVELDLDGDRLVEVRRPDGRNTAGIICARVCTPTELHPEGVTRIVLAGDPTKGLGALAEAECRRVIAALDLAEELGVPVEWYALSSGARVSMTSGTENMDWVGGALKRIVEFTQAGGEINMVIAGITVGAQPYWAAEATMLMHTRGVLVMTPDSAMVLTGKQSLDYSGGVSAEDNYGIGGYDRVMGPNGQAQYWAQDLPGAFRVLMAHYDATYVAPGEAGVRRSESADPVDRDVSSSPHDLPGSEFRTVGEIFSAELNPDRKKPFDIRSVMRAVVDADGPLMERWAGMADAETAVVADARLGGYSVCLIGIESKPVARAGFPPTDGPDTYTAGTLFPRSSKKVARAINAASGNRPLVVLANLSGFDGSPESMRNLQLEYGAEIGRAIVNFDGPIVFVVISRYHGGAFVVFSKQLNPNMTVLALEGSFASVLGGAPAAAVVFAGDVAKRTASDARIRELEETLRGAAPEERAGLQVQLADLRSTVRAEKIGEIAAEFDAVHSIHRAVEVGSVDRVISVAELRPSIIETIRRHQS